MAIRTNTRQVKKKARAKGRAILAAKASAQEPIVTAENYKTEIADAYRWYRDNWDDNQIRSAAREYIKFAKMKDVASAVTKALIGEIRIVATLGRLVMREQHVDLDHLELMFIRLAELKQLYIKDEPKVVAPVVSVQDRMLAAARLVGAEIDAELDKFCANGYASDFSTKKLLAERQISGPVAKKVGEFYKELAQELNDIDHDDDLAEGYSFLKKRELNRYREFVASIINDCEQAAVSAKAQRKPRAKKVKPPGVVVAKMKYMHEYPDLDLKSISPTKIIGAEELWLYVPEKRKLIVYYAADSDNLGVKGTSITNYDINESLVKTVRDPAKFFKSLTSTGKRAMATAWKSLKAKTSKPRSRVNDTMIILAAN